MQNVRQHFCLSDYSDRVNGIISSVNSIVHWFVKKLGLKLNKFIMFDPNTFYLVNGLLKRTYAVKADPDILNYKVRGSEKRKSADDLLQQALQKVCKLEEGSSQGKLTKNHKSVAFTLLQLHATQKSITKMKRTKQTKC